MSEVIDMVLLISLHLDYHRVLGIRFKINSIAIIILCRLHVYVVSERLKQAFSAMVVYYGRLCNHNETFSYTVMHGPTWMASLILSSYFYLDITACVIHKPFVSLNWLAIFYSTQFV